MENTFEEQRKLDRAVKKIQSIRGFYKHFAVYILVNLVLIAAKWFTLEPGESFFTYSTFSVAVFWGLGVMFHAIGVFGTNIFLTEKWEERKIREYMDKNSRQTTKWE
jgi:hypothetical protein